jgi:putative 4-mercaptohistidine N1-methyltranferase
LIDFCRKLGVPMQRALDIGCAVGGSSFALASAFEKVVGVDLSKQFIDTAQSLKENLKFPYQVKIEGDIYEEALASAEPGAADRVEFRQADACSLPAEFIDFDAVLIANLLCRLPSPGACLGRLEGMRGLLRSGGIVVIVSPYTWMEKFTPREVWLGGYYDDDGKPHFSQDGIKAMLGDQFQLLHRQDMPLLIREHRRKYQYIVSDALVFQKR